MATVTSVTELVTLTVLASVALLVPATASVFTIRRSHVEVGRRRVATLAATVALLVLLGSALAGARPLTAVVVAVGLGGSVLAWAPAGRHWAARGVAAWALTLDAGVAYLVYVAHWTLTSGLSLPSLLASSVLWLLEVFVFLLAVGYVWELVDVLARREWPRRVRLPSAGTGVRPFVSLHVPTHNEPPDMVIATLEALLTQEYDDYEILLVDNNTVDPDLWRPVQEFCARHDRITFLHLEDWPGYKSGALNYALTRTDPRAELIGIIDADYLVRPDFLARCAPLFGDASVGFVQTPQDYRDWRQSSYFRRLYHSYDYFFEVSQRSRNERNGAIFGGTMGLIRRRALDEVGGWDEWCITEDAELSLRMLRAGWGGQHVEESFGTGIMPLTFESLKRQRFRWCFGGVQILRMHWRSLLPWDRSADNHLTGSQRWAYLVGGLQWFGDVAGLLFTCFLLAGAVDAVTGEGVVVRRLSGLFLVCVVVLTLLGAVRCLGLVRRVGGSSWREAVGALGIWLALGWCVAQAAVKGSVAREGAFLRTPKVRGEARAWGALRGNPAETLLAVACLAGAGLLWWHPAVVRAALSGLLLLQAAGYGAAPLNSLAAMRADLTPELRLRRRQLLRSWPRLGAVPGRLVLGPVVVLAAVVMLFVVFVAPAQGPLPGDVPAQAQGPAEQHTQGPAAPPTSSPRPSQSSPTDTPAGTQPTQSRVSPSATGPGATPRSTAATSPTSRPSTTTTSARPTPRTTAAASPTRPTQATSPTRPTQATSPTRPGRRGASPTLPSSASKTRTRPTAAPTP